MAATFKLTATEWPVLVGALEAQIGTAKIAAVLLATLGAERTTKLVIDRKAVPLTRAEKVALINAIVPLIPGNTEREKLRNAGRAAKKAFATKERFDEAVAYIVARIKSYTATPAASAAYPVVGQGTITGYGPVNRHWKIGDGVTIQILDQMQKCNVRAYKVESVGHAKEDVLGNPAKLEQMKRATLFAVDACTKRGIYYHATLFNDNAGKTNWNNGGPALSERIKQAKAFVDWFAKMVPPNGVYVVLVGETRTAAGKELEKYGAKVLKAAGFKIGNNNGSRPQNVTSFGGVQTDFAEYHPTKTSDWPSSTRTHATSDTGAILAQLNKDNNVYGLGNPAAIEAWRKAGEAKGFDFVIYYGFDVGEFDGQSIAAMGAKAQTSVKPPDDVQWVNDIDLSKAKWHGPSGAAAAVTESLSNLRIDKDEISYALSKGTEAWEPHTGEKNCNQYACFFVYRNGQFQGGKFDWSTYSRKTRELKNIRGKYTGGIVPASGEDVWFLFMNLNGTKRTNAQKVKWP